MAPKTDTFDLRVEASSPRAPSAALVTLFAPERGVPAACALVGSELTIGRDEPASLVLPFGSVSRAHARLTRRGESWLVEDLQSRNGTFVNGARTDRAVLAHGDQLRLGAVVLQLLERGAEPFFEPPAEGPVPSGVADLVGGPTMAAVRRDVLRVARADLSVLLLGESGTGKEMVARALHATSGRRGTFAALNCAAVPAGLLEAEIFGAKRGAFTGLERDRLGFARSASGGTLFLDEIGDMPLEAQAKMLRLLDTRQVVPLGSHEPVDVDVRVISATHRPIVELMRTQQFRPDLYARLSAHTIELRPLRDRKEDIAPLVEAFLRRERTPLRPTPAFMIGLLRYDWPLNVRELQSAIRRAVALAGTEAAIDEAHLPPAVLAIVGAAIDDEPAPRPSVLTTAPSAAELRALVHKYAGNIAAVARALGKDRAQIHRWLRQHAIDPDTFRK